MQQCPFEGICLTDTFQMYESDDLISHYMPDNSERRKRQKATDIRVIMGNPPYSKGQESANDDNANVSYSGLDGRIKETYAARSTKTSIKNLYDSYIRAIRWASDRIGNSGILAYVSNAGWLDGNFADGLRACLSEEFTDLYVFHLRGNQRTSGERSRKEGGKVFGSGSRAPIAISVFVKNPDIAAHGRIFFHDIGDYLDQKQKLAIIRDFGGMKGISNANGWERVTPDEQNDWLRQRDASFEAFIKIGDKKDKSGLLLFENYSLGINSNRDAWAYNASKKCVAVNMAAMIDVYNAEVQRLSSKPPGTPTSSFILKDPEKISWSSSLIPRLERAEMAVFSPEHVELATYRPFCKSWVYFDKMFIHRMGQMPSIFPERAAENLIITVPGISSRTPFASLMLNAPTDLNMVDGGVQCFPLYLYDQKDEELGGLFQGEPSGLQRRDGITDAGLKHFKDAYPGETITKEDLFYYVYGLLHSEDYRAKYADNLSKELPRIPRVKTAANFWAFSRAGRDLGDLHVNYETVEPYPVTIKQGDLRLADIKNPGAFYRVTKWAFGKAGKEKDKTTVIYNANITMQDIPLEAYDYVVNGKPALEWVMERQVVKTDKASGIVNDANRYAIETMNNPAYPLELFQRVITVSLRTMEIVRGLPKLEVM